MALPPSGTITHFKNDWFRVVQFLYTLTFVLGHWQRPGISFRSLLTCKAPRCSAVPPILFPCIYSLIERMTEEMQPKTYLEKVIPVADRL